MHQHIKDRETGEQGSPQLDGRWSQAIVVVISVPSCSKPAPNIVVLLHSILLLIKPTRSVPHTSNSAPSIAWPVL